MKRGITFDIPNEFGRFAADILKPFPISSYTWFIGDGEAYTDFKEDTDTDLFPQNKRIIEGQELRQRLEGNPYYMIFAELKAFPSGMVRKSIRMRNIWIVPVNLCFSSQIARM
ncbi:MAG: DUF2691 family protein [Bacillus velezensis]|nr:DUF2691 family protein [Bacillus velezensis]MCT6831825.1 DUF2691 family protein [Bacillus velezensis]MCT6864546.1 DUF2691 family protein [Bacillus velezensis]